jgi:hypothetical protein
MAPEHILGSFCSNRKVPRTWKLDFKPLGPMVHCTGCNREFSASGFTRHVNSMTTAVCRATYNNLIPSDDVGDNDIDMENTGGNFEGDFFGPDYEQAEFGWLEGDETIGMEPHYLESCKYLQFIARADESEEQSEEGDEDEANDPGVDLEHTSHTLHTPGAPPLPEVSPSKNYIIEQFPGDQAGAPLEHINPCQSNFEKYQQQLNNNTEYAPFTSRVDWEIARWAKIYGPSSNAVNELLKIDGVSLSFRRFLFNIANVIIQVVDKLGLSYKNACELNIIIDQRLPNRPCFQRHDLKIGSETATMYSCDILQCIQALYSNHEFAAQLIHKPERHYQQLGDEKFQVFHDMHTGSWWWEIQVSTLR